MRRLVTMLVVAFAVGLAASSGAWSRADEPPAGPLTAAFADYLESAYGEETPPEGARMLMAILRGSRMGPGEGWFGPAESRYSWDWLAARHGVDAEAGIARERFQGSDELFAILDRNRDGTIRPGDLDWSDSNPYVQLSSALNRIFRRLDTDGSGALSRDDWNRLYDGAAGPEGDLSADEFAARLLEGEGGGFTPGDAPTTEMLLKGLFAGEIGSMEAGPKVGDPAPRFRLREVRGEGSRTIDDLLGEKPLVLVFGNFTCGPFRASYPAVDALHARCGDRANFLMVYVREAHPEEGWKMESNTKAGVTVAQPKSFAERVEVAGRFCARLEPSMPVVVDDVNDSVGHAYSAMPARLYLVDRGGRIVYKSGRGPFGFKPRELEQALAMHLLESSPDSPAAAAAPAAPAAPVTDAPAP